jgi:hypothetical protein
MLSILTLLNDAITFFDVIFKEGDFIIIIIIGRAV